MNKPEQNKQDANVGYENRRKDKVRIQPTIKQSTNTVVLQDLRNSLKSEKQEKKEIIDLSTELKKDHVFIRLKQILQKPFHYRSREDRDMLYDYLRNIKFFTDRKIPENVLRRFCAGFDYIHKPRNSYIINHNEDGD